MRGLQIYTGHIIIRSDLALCSTIPAIKLRIFLPDPLESFNMQVHSLDNLPFYISNADAAVTLSKAVPKNLISSPRVRQLNQVVEIARPLAQDMKLLKPPLTCEFNQYVPFKVSFTLTVIIFIVSTVLPFVFMYVYHRCILKDRILPKSSEENKTIQPVLEVPNECSKEFSEELAKCCHLLGPDSIQISQKPPNGRENITSGSNLQASTSLSPAGNTHLWKSIEHSCDCYRTWRVKPLCVNRENF